MKIKLDLGETRHVRLMIHSCKNQDFEIINASYSLRKIGEEEPEDEGECVIIGHEIDTLISPKSEGYYNLKIIYHIVDETLIDIVEVKVS